MALSSSVNVHSLSFTRIRIELSMLHYTYTHSHTHTHTSIDVAGPREVRGTHHPVKTEREEGGGVDHDHTHHDDTIHRPKIQGLYYDCIDL